MLDPVFVKAETEAMKNAVENGLMDNEAEDPKNVAEVVVPDGDSE